MLTIREWNRHHTAVLPPSRPDFDLSANVQKSRCEGLCEAHLRSSDSAAIKAERPNSVRRRFGLVTESRWVYGLHPDPPGPPGKELAVPPVISPDGRFYWDGQRWVPLPAAGQVVTPANGSGRRTGGVGVVGGIVVAVVIVFIWIASARNTIDGCPGGSFCVQVTNWSVGSADVTGMIINATDAGCSHPDVTLHLWDHNNAKVRDFQFGAGDLANRTKRSWNTHMVGFLYIDEPVESNVTRISADVTCSDQHNKQKRGREQPPDPGCHDSHTRPAPLRRAYGRPPDHRGSRRSTLLRGYKTTPQRSPGPSPALPPRRIPVPDRLHPLSGTPQPQAVRRHL